jgi:hypothetical protein
MVPKTLTGADKAAELIERALEAINDAASLLATASERDEKIEAWRRDLAGARRHLAGLPCLSVPDARGIVAALAYSAKHHPNAEPDDLRSLAERVDPVNGARDFNLVGGF